MIILCHTPLQVLDFVKSFKSSTIREHMSHALSHLQYGPAPSQDTDTTSQGGVATVRSKMPIKDYRSAYYTKMGFLKDGAGIGLSQNCNLS